MILASAIDWHGLIRVVWISVVAGVGLSLLFSIAIAGAARASSERRLSHARPAALWSVAAAASAVVCMAAVVFGVVVMLNK